MPSMAIARCRSVRSFLLVAIDGRFGKLTENSSPLTVYLLHVSGSDASIGFCCPETAVANRTMVQSKYKIRYIYLLALIEVEVVLELHPHRDKFSVFHRRNKLHFFRSFNSIVGESI